MPIFTELRNEYGCKETKKNARIGRFEGFYEDLIIVAPEGKEDFRTSSKLGTIDFKIG